MFYLNASHQALFLPRDITHVRPSVTLRYRDHIGGNTSKIISRLVSLRCSLFADTSITDLSKGTPQKFDRNRR